MTLIDQIVRNRVFSCRYWKEECFGLTAVTLVDKAINLDCVGTENNLYFQEQLILELGNLHHFFVYSLNYYKSTQKKK